MSRPGKAHHSWALGSALRQWAARPENLSARNELLRALHTLKGSARLAGAMRLGEMAHRMETAVEQIGTNGVTTAAVEPLLTGVDAVVSLHQGRVHAQRCIVLGQGALGMESPGFEDLLAGPS